VFSVALFINQDVPKIKIRQTKPVYPLFFE
jgi:hypothetical protein